MIYDFSKFKKYAKLRKFQRYFALGARYGLLEKSKTHF